MEVINFLLDNKEWLFSGLGVTICTVIGTYIYRKFLNNNEKDSDKKIININQSQSGNNNKQIGIQNNYSEREDDNGRKNNKY